MIKQIIFSVAACLTVFGSECSYQASYHRKPAKQEVQNALQRPTITVWVHGTRNSQRIPLPGFKKVWKTIPGLHHTSAYKNMWFNNMSRVAKGLNQADAKQFPLESLYIFGWSGLLNPTKRKEAANRLYDSLIDLQETIETEKGVKPLYRVITHSHGGNVALLLAEVKKDKKKKIKIDELVLLACPVQKRTSCYTKNAMFKTMYHFYSPIDLTQVIDPQILQDPLSDMEGPVFSERTFPEQKNLIQLDIGPIMHVSFFGKRFLKRLPKLLNATRPKEQKQSIFRSA